MRNILVTGGAGYIGSHACKKLKSLGFTPVTVDNLITGWQDAVRFGPFENVDLLNKSQINEVFKNYKPVAVMHFASLSQVGESVEKPSLYWENNVIGSLNLINAAIENECENFIFSSTCATYGDQDNVILNEDCLQQPINAYGSSKYAVENILKNIGVSNNLKYVIFRYFNVSGADPDTEIGEFHRPETHLIPLVLDVAIGKREQVTIFGTDYETTDGTCIRDYVHVCDLVDAHVLGLKWLQNGQGSRVFNLGTGHGFSVRDIINQTIEITNCSVKFVEGARRPGDCAKLVSASNRAKVELGWLASRSNLEDMIIDAWHWHKKGHYFK
jgi:UDP-glucose 4-epimerase